MKYQLAQFNIARMKSPTIDAPAMQSFVAQLDTINALAESADGFVWRLNDESDNATAFNPYNDPQIIVNLSVWKSVETLKTFTYKTAHAGLIRQRADWFQAFGKAAYVLWWVDKDHRPSLSEAQARLQQLQEVGPSPDGFTFKQTFPPPQA